MIQQSKLATLKPLIRKCNKNGERIYYQRRNKPRYRRRMTIS
jgi:hypothetical protein